MHATKSLTTGEGGIITTNSKKACLNIKNLRDHGVNKFKVYYYNQVGGNFRLSNILAAIGYSQLSRVNQIIKKKPYIIFDVAHNTAGFKSYIQFYNTLNIIGKSNYIPMDLGDELFSRLYSFFMNLYNFLKLLHLLPK